MVWLEKADDPSAASAVAHIPARRFRGTRPENPKSGLRESLSAAPIGCLVPIHPIAHSVSPPNSNPRFVQQLLARGSWGRDCHTSGPAISPGVSLTASSAIAKSSVDGAWGGG